IHLREAGAEVPEVRTLGPAYVAVALLERSIAPCLASCTVRTGYVVPGVSGGTGCTVNRSVATKLGEVAGIDSVVKDDGSTSQTEAHFACQVRSPGRDRKSTRLNSSHEWSSYAVFCLK